MTGSRPDYAGIVAYGAYIPWRRLRRAAIAQAHSWSNPAAAAAARGERAMASWDEDSITMAVAAARDALDDNLTGIVDSVLLGSSTLPFADRQNAAVVAGALGLPETVQSADFSGSLRAGTTALRHGLESVLAGSSRSALVVASDTRLALPMSTQELQIGDAAACVVIGTDKPLARYIGGGHSTVDFVDHFRESGAQFDYTWEERWVRDEGYKKIVPRTIKSALERSGISADSIVHFILPTSLKGVDAEVLRLAGLTKASIAANLLESIGDSGCAHPVLQLACVLEEAKPGERILLAGFAQGCDVLIFETTADVRSRPPKLGVSGHLAVGRPDSNYLRYLVFKRLLDVETGKRAERDKQTALTTMYRRRHMLGALTGGICRNCGARQFPKARICVNPECAAVDSQSDFSFRDVPARVMSWSADYLTFTPDPPLHYGLVDFTGGGRFMVEFTDCEPGELRGGRDIEAVYRIKDFDDLRGFRRYFWKFTPRRVGTQSAGKGQV